MIKFQRCELLHQIEFNFPAITLALKTFIHVINVSRSSRTLQQWSEYGNVYTNYLLPCELYNNIWNMLSFTFWYTGDEEGISWSYLFGKQNSGKRRQPPTVINRFVVLVVVFFSFFFFPMFVLTIINKSSGDNRTAMKRKYNYKCGCECNKN